MKRYRLAPFSSWQREGDRITLVTPECELAVAAGRETEETLTELQQGWTEETPFINALAQYGAVTASRSREAEMLRCLDDFFKTRGIVANLVQKGATGEEFALTRECFVLRAGPFEGYGQDDQKEFARLKAAAEAYERFSCLEEYNTEVVTSSDSGVAELDWRQFFEYKEWQYETPEFPCGQEPSGKWVVVREIYTGELRRVPAEIVFFSSSSAKNIVAVTNSSGVACHSSYGTAVLSSAYELIERDALMVHWFQERPREQIIPPPQLQKRVEKLKKLGFTCVFLNLSLELAPVVLVILQRESEYFPRLILGMASHPLPVKAMEKALQEVELNVTFSGIETQVVEKPEGIRGTKEHLLWYDQPENHQAVLSLIGPERIQMDAISEGPSDLQDLYNSLQRHDFSWYIIDLNEAGRRMTGLHTVRSLIGGLTPIGFGYKMEPLGMERLRRPPAGHGCGQDGSPRTTREGYLPQPFA